MEFQTGLTTRARAEHWRRQNYLTVPPPPARFVPVEERPAYRFATSLLRLVVTLLFLLILGTALYPAGQRTRPLRVEEEMPVGHTTWYESDYLN